LLISGEVHSERPSVSSVSSEAVASLSFQTAPPKPARASQPSDHFAALVDSSTCADVAAIDRASSSAPQQPPSRRRSDDASAAAADNARSRETAAADQAARKNSDERDARRLSDASPNADANPNVNANPVQQSTAKLGTVKADGAKSTDKPASDKTSAADASTAPAGATQQDAASLTTPIAGALAVAVAIPVAIGATDVSAAAPASGNAAAPLAIAAAAIAASAAATSAPTASPPQIKTDAGAAVTTTVPADTTVSTAVPLTAPGTASTVNVAVPAAACAAIVTPGQQATQTSSNVVTDMALATAAAAPAPALAAAAVPVAPNTTLLKAPTAADAKTTASGASDTAIAPGTSDTSVTPTATEAAHTMVAQQPPVAGKPEAGNGNVDAAKADAAASSSSPSGALVSAHEHSSATTTVRRPSDSSDTGIQLAGPIQPQLPAAEPTAASVGPLSVAAATNLAVPLNGLAIEIAASAKSGKSRFEIRLDPADLGRIDVRIDVDRNGQVTSHLRVEKPETLAMLRQDAPQLQRQLDDAGFKTADGGLQFSLRDQSSSGQNSGKEAGRNAQRLVVSDEEIIPVAVAGRTYGRVLGSSNGVDIRV
jgi:flagellar hook-length control protein FliK